MYTQNIQEQWSWVCWVFSEGKENIRVDEASISKRGKKIKQIKKPSNNKKDIFFFFLYQKSRLLSSNNQKLPLKRILLNKFLDMTMILLGQNKKIIKSVAPPPDPHPSTAFVYLLVAVPPTQRHQFHPWERLLERRRYRAFASSTEWPGKKRGGWEDRGRRRRWFLQVTTKSLQPSGTDEMMGRKAIFWMAAGRLLWNLGVFWMNLNNPIYCQ